MTGLVSTLVFGFSFYRYNKELSSTIEEAISESIKQADLISKKTHEELLVIEKLGEELISKNIGELAENQQIELIRQALKDEKEVYGIGLIHDPAHNGQKEDLLISRGSEERYRLKDDPEQWLEERLWYENYKENPKTWSDSAFLEGLNKKPKVQMAKMIGDASNPQGALFFHLSLSNIEQILNSAKLGNAGYSFIISQSGHFIYHPVDEWVLSGKTIYNSGYSGQDQTINNSIQKALKGEKELLEFANPINGLDTWYFFEPIPGTDWVLGVTFFREEMVNNIFNRRQHQIVLSVTFIASIGFLLLGINFMMRSTTSTYLTVAMVTIVLLFGIIYIISISFKYPTLKPYDLEASDVKITELPVLEHFIDIQDSIFAQYQDVSPTYIKTGIFVEHADLREAHLVMVSGYIWQTYDLELHKDIRQGIVFPEAAPHPEYLNVEEAFREVRDGKEIVGWYFRVGLRKKFNYEHFPFDWQNIRIKIWHPDFINNVICVPDLSGYPILNPTSLPGINAKFEFPNWTVKQSFFSFKSGVYNTDFGLRLASSRRQMPELCFNMYIKRIYISPLVSNIFTIAIIIILLFVAQVIESNRGKNGGKGVLLGSLGLIELSAAFSFVLIIAHTSLRDNLSVEELIYIDFYYFTTYFMILLTCVNFILMDKNLKKMQDKNMTPKTDWLKIHFWPIVFGLFYLVTVAVFY